MCRKQHASVPIKIIYYFIYVSFGQICWVLYYPSTPVRPCPPMVNISHFVYNKQLYSKSLMTYPPFVVPAKIIHFS